jgi:hypothetical protein
VLSQEHAAQLGERLRRIVERPDEHLPLGDVQRQHLRLAVVCRLELLGKIVEAGLAH